VGREEREEKEREKVVGREERGEREEKEKVVGREERGERECFEMEI